MIYQQSIASTEVKYIFDQKCRKKKKNAKERYIIKKHIMYNPTTVKIHLFADEFFD